MLSRLVVFFVLYFNIHYVYSISKFDLSSAHGRVKWILENKNGSIKVPGTVPGGVYSDLENAGVIGDILAGFNDVNTRWVAYDTWSYTGTFKLKQYELDFTTAKLIFDGVDTVAFITLNNVPVGSTDNMFVQYIFDIRDHLKVGENLLTINFVSPIAAASARSEQHYTAPQCVPDVYHGECHANQLRKMQASFAWDWGPAFPSVGIWRQAAIEFYNSTVIRSITTHIEKVDTFWHVKVKAYLQSDASMRTVKAYLSATLHVDGNQSLEIVHLVETAVRNDGMSEGEVNIVVHENVVRLWWPNGFGDQPLYDLQVRLTTDDGQQSSANIKIGFRTLELIEEDASKILGHTTAGDGLTFYFKVNGYPLFMKGSNWIPANVLPEHGYEKHTVDNLLGAARDTHMAMLRVWGGGVYESDYFYQRCDELGILIWQDFLFACSMYPVDAEFLDSVRKEIEHNVIRLQHHPSITLWAGNNENEVALRGNWYGTAMSFDKYKEEYIKLYVNTIKPIVNELDPGRRYLVSSPSNGIKSEEEGYIALNPYDSHYGDTHYYNYVDDNWDANIYPATRFASEYGFQSLPSLKTMSTATKNQQDYQLHSNYSRHRQHSPNGYIFIENQILRHLKLEKDDPEYFSKFVFYSQITQAMATKAETEYYRQSQATWYTMGALYWQLNDIWQAPSWAGIEYGGKWKMLHYFSKSFFAPVLVSPRLLPAGDIDVYLINDRFVPIENGHIIVDYFNYSSLTPFRTNRYTATVQPLSSEKQFTLDFWRVSDKNKIFLRFSLRADGITSSPFNYIFPKPLKEAVGLKTPDIKIIVSQPSETEDGQFKNPIEIEVDTVVLFLWLEVDLPGQLRDNGFIITQPSVAVDFISSRQYTQTEIKRALTYQYYMN